MILRPMQSGLIVALITIAADQLTKWVILTQVMVPPHPIPVLPFFSLVLAWNKGVSFSLFSSDSTMTMWILVGIALAITFFLLIWLHKIENLLLSVGLGLIIGGAIGNVIDRLRFGAVVDFLLFYVSQYHWPAFNLADTAITIGVGIIILDALKSKRT